MAYPTARGNYLFAHGVASGRMFERWGPFASH
jgi:hypothetical protein